MPVTTSWTHASRPQRLNARGSKKTAAVNLLRMMLPASWASRVLGGYSVLILASSAAPSMDHVSRGLASARQRRLAT